MAIGVWFEDIGCTECLYPVLEHTPTQAVHYPDRQSLLFALAGRDVIERVIGKVPWPVLQPVVVYCVDIIDQEVGDSCSQIGV